MYQLKIASTLLTGMMLNFILIWHLICQDPFGVSRFWTGELNGVMMVLPYLHSLKWSLFSVIYMIYDILFDLLS